MNARLAFALSFALLLAACDGPRAGANDADLAGANTNADLAGANTNADLAGMNTNADLAGANANADLARADGGSLADLAHTSIGAGPFAGNWLCQTTSTTTFNSPPSSTTANGADYVNVIDGTATDLILQFQGGFFGACDLGADRSASNATLTPGQQCSTTSSGVTIVFTVTTGSAAVSPGTLLIDVSGPISGAMGTSSVSGSFTASYQCVPQ